MPEDDFKMRKTDWDSKDHHVYRIFLLRLRFELNRFVLETLGELLSF
jgi:hypothetical protein